MSSTRKRRLHEAIQFDQEQHEFQERQKKYSGPVGKNPWGGIAKDWTAKLVSFIIFTGVVIQRRSSS